MHPCWIEVFSLKKTILLTTNFWTLVYVYLIEKHLKAEFVNIYM